MRLSQKEIKEIPQTAREIFGPEIEVKLFGSRVDDAKRGGDIDLLILVPEANLDRARELKYRFLDSLQGKIGEQRIDVVITTDAKVQEDPFLQSLECRGF